MRFLAKKIPAMLAMILSLFAVALLIACKIAPVSNDPAHAWDKLAYLIYALYFLIGSEFFYLVDAVLLFIRAHFGVNSIFNIVLATLIICAIPIFFIFIGRVYMLVVLTFVIIFILEIISIIQHVK